jgi:alanine dehydrogenase
MPLLLTEEDVAKAVTPLDIIEAVEDGFRQHGLGLAQTQPRREVRIRGKELPHADPRMVRIAQGLAFLEQSAVAVTHHIFSFPDRGRPMRIVNHLIDADNGDLVAVVESLGLLGMRTGAASAVGAKYLSRKDSSVAGIVGTGRQGRIQLRFLSKVRSLKKAYAYSLVPSETDKFCDEMSAELGIDVSHSESIEQLVRRSDILVTATNSTTPFVKAEWLSPGIHVNIMGADDRPKIELEGAALKKAGKLVIAAEDSLAAGQLQIPMAEGVIERKDIYGTIGEIVAGSKPGRENDDEITIFHTPGLTLQDAAATHKAYVLAKRLGLGTNSDLSFFP